MDDRTISRNFIEICQEYSHIYVGVIRKGCDFMALNIGRVLFLRGTATGGTAPIKFAPTDAVLLTNPEEGAFEPVTDDISYTIKTGTARKQLVMTDGAKLATGYMPVAATNGRLVNVTPQAHEADLKANYVAGELDSEAEIITAINATNTTVNSIIAKLEALKLFATS